ncbi:MAG: hypothetical protein ACJ79S_20215, partial [Gemmatimonadaceae bacterium]
MDDLDRMFRRLVGVIRAEHPAYFDKPFEVAELYQQIIPYRHHRRELGFETNQDYELALMRLLSGERGYAIGDSRMQERLRQELTSSSPDTSIFRGFASTMISLDPEAVRRAESPDFGARPAASDAVVPRADRGEGAAAPMAERAGAAAAAASGAGADGAERDPERSAERATE